MEQRPLGRSGAQLSAIGFGCMGLVGWYGERNDVEARAAVLEALELGVWMLRPGEAKTVARRIRDVLKSA